MKSSFPAFLSPPLAAKIFGIDPEKVRKWIDSGELRAFNVATRRGGRPRWRIRDTDLELFLAARESPARKAPIRARRTTTKDAIRFF